MIMGEKWLLLSYNLPTRPSRHRVQLWRGLRRVGAVNVQQSVWILPYTEDNIAEMTGLTDLIESNDGNALLFESQFLKEEHREKVLAQFKIKREGVENI